jgi:hypothetical protein
MIIHISPTHPTGNVLTTRVHANKTPLINVAYTNEATERAIVNDLTFLA